VLAKFQLKIIIIRLLTKKTQDTQADLQISPTLFRLIVACLIVVLLCILPHRFICDEDRRLLRFIVVFGGRISLRWLRAAPDFEQYCSVLSPFTLPRTVDCYVSQSIPALLIPHSNVSRADCFNPPPSRAHLVLKSCSNPPSLHLRAAMRRLFHQTHGKIYGLIGDGGEGRHQQWCQMALVAIVR
jgi:hypothetical protein